MSGGGEPLLAPWCLSGEIGGIIDLRDCPFAGRVDTSKRRCPFRRKYMPMHRSICALAGVLLLLAARAFAQAPATATLRVTVVDPSSAIVVGATVTVTGIDDATKAATIPPSTTDNAGIATIANVRPGRYKVQAEFPGFDV